MKIKAKFKGADGSLGYRNGENYNLEVFTADGQLHVHLQNSLPSGYCVYATFRAFLNNWQVF